MSGCADDSVSFVPKQGTITVAGGIKLPIHGIGLGRLRCRLPDSSTHPIKLINTLRSSEFYVTRLFSWSYIHHRGFDHFGRYDNVYISREGKPIIWAMHTGGVIQIQIDVLSTGNSAQYHNDAISSDHQDLSKFAPHTDKTATANCPSYREFYEATGHLHIKMIMANRLYADAGEIPTRPTDFHCETCELSQVSTPSSYAIHTWHSAQKGQAVRGHTLRSVRQVQSTKPWWRMVLHFIHLPGDTSPMGMRPAKLAVGLPSLP
ncbi:hypothetical protein J1614_003894 [Plenodomus biglobosus]|nr:hypothetical protein J1614_003894 [Plenodomus biglobosus]